MYQKLAIVLPLKTALECKSGFNPDLAKSKFNQIFLIFLTEPELSHTQ